MFERADGKELLVGATVRELSAKIKKSPSSISSNAFWKKEIVPLREAWKAKIKADHNAVINAKARSEDDFGRDVQ